MAGYVEGGLDRLAALWPIRRALAISPVEA
jgi:hypothetical protein